MDRRRWMAASLAGAFCLPLANVWGLPLPGAEPATVTTQTVLELGFLDDAGTIMARESVALRVTSDGAILLPRESDGALYVADRMTPEQLAGLQRELESIGRLGEIESAKLRSELHRACEVAGFVSEISGAAETVIRQRCRQGPVEVRCAGLSVMAARFPDFPEVQRLLTVQLRLQNVAAVARAGGEQASQHLATIANRTLKISRPELPPLTPRDLSMVRELSSGSRYVQFYRSPTKTSDELLVSLFETPGQPPQVNVLANPSAP